jgi:ketosteroid isomerase-like protein
MGTRHESLCNEVLKCSQQWIEAFNQGNVTACIAAYTTEAIMHAKPMGTFHGIEAIENFWKEFMASRPSNLEYSEVKLETVDGQTVLLSANWRMSLGRGIITMEKWVKQTQGEWKLEQDDFEVLEQFSPPTAQ